MNLKRMEELYRQISDRAFKHVVWEGYVPKDLYEIYLKARALRDLMKEQEQEHERERVPAGQPDGGEWMPGGGDKHPHHTPLHLSASGAAFIKKHEGFKNMFMEIRHIMPR
jgi:hypothetical protein